MSTKHKVKDAKHSKNERKKEGDKDKGKKYRDKKDKGKGRGDGNTETTTAEEPKNDEISLSVAVYRPEEGNLHHWALHLEPYNCLYEVIGEAMAFTADVKYDVIPSSSGRFVESVPVAKINQTDTAELHRIITETPVQNDVQGWSCQDYVIEALELLNGEQIVDDEDYEKARRRLLRRFNR